MTDYSKHIWYNGKIIDWDTANTHVMSHVLHYGSGVFEGIKCYDNPNGPAIFRLTEHMERLHQSAASFKINIPFSSNLHLRYIFIYYYNASQFNLYIVTVTSRHLNAFTTYMLKSR